MKTPIARGRACLVVVACLLAPLAMQMATAKDKPPENWDGLELRKVKGLDLVYVRPNTEFAPYNSVLFDEVKVEFAKNWEKNQDFSRRPTASDMQEIRDKLGALVREVFSEELSKHGYSLVQTANDDTLHVSSAIIDLYINAPDTSSPGRVRTYTTSAGRMTLVLECRDGPSGQLLARVIDQRTDDGLGGQMQWTNSVTNTADARRAIQVWAERLRKSLDKLNGKEK